MNEHDGYHTHEGHNVTHSDEPIVIEGHSDGPITMTERIFVQAKDLKAGDTLVPTFRVVEWIGQTVTTPRGKVCVIARPLTGSKKDKDVASSHYWWKTTRIRVIRNTRTL